MTEHKESLRKWLRVLFDAQIASIALTVINAVTYLDSITVWVNRALPLVVIWSLFQIKEVSPRYRTAAITRTGSLICSLLTLPVNTSGLGLSSILMLAGSTCLWITEYQEYHGHGELVAEADEKLAKRWKDLFIWEVVIALGTSVISIGGVTLLMTMDLLTTTISTILIAVTTVIGLITEGLYLLYMKRTLNLLDN